MGKERLYDPVISQESAVWVDTRSKTGTIEQLITSIGATVCTLLVNTAESFADNDTIPSTISLKFTPNGSFAIANTKNLTIQTTNIEAGNHQIFSGAGDFDFADGTILKSSWFADFSAGLTYIGPTDIVVYKITEDETISASDEITSNIFLDATSGNILSDDASNAVLTISGDIFAGERQFLDWGTGSGSVTYRDGQTVKALWHGSFMEAIADITSTSDIDLVISESETITANLTVTNNFNLIFIHGAILSDDGNNAALSIAGGIQASSWQQLFDWGNGTGAITIVQKVFPDWFKKNTTPGTTDMTDAIQEAFNASFIIEFLRNNYAVDTQLTIGIADGTEREYTIIMPPGSLITSTLASTYAFKATNCIKSQLELRMSATTNGVLIEQSGDAGGAWSSYFNTVTGTLTGPGRNGTKTAVGAGTAGVTISAPTLGRENYYHLIDSVYVDAFDIGVHLEFAANGNTIRDCRYSNYWYANQISSSDNELTSRFFTNASGIDGSNLTEALRIGDTSSVCHRNIATIKGEPGTFAQMLFLDVLAEDNSIRMTSNTGAVANTINNDDNLVINEGEIRGYDLIVQNNLNVTGPIRKGNADEGGTGTINIKSTHETHVLAAASTSATTTLTIPSGALLIGAQCTVNVQVQDGGAGQWSSAFSGGSTTAIQPAWGASGVGSKSDKFIVPEVATGATEITFTASSGSFSAGTIEVVAYYLDFTSMAN